MPDIDGIKKIDKAELEKSRKIVLDSIRAVEKENINDKGRLQAKTLPKIVPKSVQDIKPKKSLASLFFLKKKTKPLAKEKAAETTVFDVAASERKGVNSGREMKLAASEKMMPKISDEDKALWQSDMKNLFTSDKLASSKEAAAPINNKAHESMPGIEKVLPIIKELTINKNPTNDVSAPKAISGEDKKRFYSDIKDLPLLRKKPADIVQKKTILAEKMSNSISATAIEKNRSSFTAGKIEPLKKEKVSPWQSHGKSKGQLTERKIIIEHTEDDNEFDFSLNTYKKFKANESVAPDLLHDKTIGQAPARQVAEVKRKNRVSPMVRLRHLAVRLADAWLDAKVYFFIALILFVTFYSFFAVMTLKAGVDTRQARWLAEWMPVPAVITAKNIVEYYPFIDMQKQYCRGACSLDQKKDFKIWLVDRIIFFDLANKYEIRDMNDIDAQIRKYIIFDPEINQVGINRVKKIKNMIDEGENFYSIAQKFGDSFGQFKIGQIEGAIKDLDVNLSEIADKKTSRITYGLDGYYLFYVDKEVSPDSVAYVFIAARSLEDYLSEKLDGFRIWSLVD